MHGWGVTRGMSSASHLSRSRLPLMHTYASMTSESSPLPPYTPPLSTSASRSLPLQLLLALFTTLVVLSSLLQFAGLHPSLRYVGDDNNDHNRAASATAAPLNLLAVTPPSDLFDSDIFQVLLERLDAVAVTTEQTQTSEADASFTLAFDDKRVHNGDFVAMNDAATAPTITIEADDAASHVFTYVLIDIDAPDPHNPSHAPFLHYIVEDLTAGDKGHVVVPYYPVTPPVGEHRYVSLLFRQPATDDTNKDDSSDDASLTKRANFDVAAFAEARGLVLVHTTHFVSHPANERAAA